MTRPLDKHIDEPELNALVPSNSDDVRAFHGLSLEAIRAASRHMASCVECSSKVAKYRLLVDRSFLTQSRLAALRGTRCPNDDVVDWYEVAAGLWPTLRTLQLIRHSAVCDSCGPRLRAAAFLYNNIPTPEEACFLSELKSPSQPEAAPETLLPSPGLPSIVRWCSAAALAVMLLIAFILLRPSSRVTLSGPVFAEMAVHAHEQYAKGRLELEVRSHSQQALNDWFKEKVPFEVRLPANPPISGEIRPFQVEGARLVQAGGKSAVFIAYQMKTGPATLVVAPETTAVASGGMEANFKTVSFHYATIDGFKVVTWTQHGRTYALVSDEGNRTQQSCMICHSAMRDRDLTNTPTPLVTSLLE